MSRKSTVSMEEIKCPHCGRLIPITETLQHQLTEQVKAELEADIARQEKELLEREKGLNVKEKELEGLEKNIEQKVRKELDLKLKSEKLRFEEKESELKKREKELVSAEQNVRKRVKEQLDEARKKIEQEAKRNAEDALSVELKDLREQNLEKEKRLKNSEKRELDLMRRQRELEDKERNFELELMRKISEEREKIESEAAKKVSEEYHLKELEMKKQNSDLLRQLEDWKRKAEQGSQQLQGEVLELELEKFLQTSFPLDQIQPVPKGIAGADVVQNVFTKNGQAAGIILYESKRTKNWSEGWLQKLKDDQRELKADIAVLVSEVLPKDIDSFGFRNGIWVTHYKYIFWLATSLRMNLIQVATVKLAAVGKNEKLEVLYNYLSGSEFRQRVEAIVEAFTSMRSDLDKEKKAYLRIWAKREKQIERVVKNTSGMYGDMQALIGSSMPTISALELPLIEGPEEVTEEEESTEDILEESDEEVDVREIPF